MNRFVDEKKKKKINLVSLIDTMFYENCQVIKYTTHFDILDVNKCIDIF